MLQIIIIALSRSGLCVNKLFLTKCITELLQCTIDHETMDDLSQLKTNIVLSLLCPVVKSILFKLANNNIREAPSVAM